MTVGIVIPTLNAAHHLPHCIPFYLRSRCFPRVLVIDSSSSDRTVDIAKAYGAETVTVARESFNHGLTREMGRRHLATDIVVMATPDAYPESDDTLDRLIEPLLAGEASIAYARQLPRKGAGFFEAFPRQFNYPEVGHIRSIRERADYGSYTFFCSDSLAAYRNTALDSVGGFKSVLLGEDTLATAELLTHGHHIAYVAESRVYHSHDYGLWEEFQRYFDTGYAREELRKWLGDDSGRGREFVQAMCRELVVSRPHLLPYALLQTVVKWSGYRLGTKGRLLPLFLRRFLSAHKAYWA